MLDSQQQEQKNNSLRNLGSHNRGNSEKLKKQSYTPIVQNSYILLKAPNSPTVLLVLQFYSPIVLQPYSLLVIQTHSPIVQHAYSIIIVLLFYGPIGLQAYRTTILQSYIPNNLQSYNLAIFRFYKKQKNIEC